MKAPYFQMRSVLLHNKSGSEKEEKKERVLQKWYLFLGLFVIVPHTFVVGTLSNMTKIAETWKCPSQSLMHPKDNFNCTSATDWQMAV